MNVKIQITSDVIWNNLDDEDVKEKKTSVREKKKINSKIIQNKSHCRLL